MKKGGSTS